MKKLIAPAMCFLVFTGIAFAQEPEASAIKLFVDSTHISRVNNNLTKDSDNFSEVLCRRLYSKTVQLVNQTGVAEIGYSTFLLTPKFDVINVSLDETGFTKTYLAECELGLFVSRRDYGSSSGASYASFSKKITGSGSTKQSAIANAVNSISPTDSRIVAFLNQAKIKIDNYFQANCQQVVKEGDRASELQEYDRAIALYFSIPSSAKKCYDEAFQKSMGIYKKYIENICDKQLLRLKAEIVLADNKDAKIANGHYDEALLIMSEMSPVSEKCYAEAKVQLAKIENRFNEQQKREWEMEQKKLATSTEVQKEMYKAMGRISSNYQPPAPSGGTIIIAR